MTTIYFTLLLLMIISLIPYNESLFILPLHRSKNSHSKKINLENKRKQINQINYYKNLCNETIYPYEYTSKLLTCSEIVERNERIIQFRKNAIEINIEKF
jgi:hypothetical protein